MAEGRVLPFPGATRPPSGSGDGEGPRLFPPRRAAALPIVPGDVVRSVKERIQRELMNEDRGAWMANRLQRYAKYRGWRREDKSWPWPHSSDTHLPILQAAELRLNAGLHNAILSLRPLFRAVATRRDQITKEEKITQLIDAQLFVDPGPERAERAISDYVSNFLQDGNAVAYTPWVRAEQQIVTRHYGAPPADDDTAEQYVLDFLLGSTRGAARFRAIEEMTPAGAGTWEITYRDAAGIPRRATVTGRQDAHGVEVTIHREATAWDGPVMQVIPIDALILPLRVANLQPPSAWNPEGSPWVVLQLRLTLGEVKRRKATKEFNWLDDAGLNQIQSAVRQGSGLLTRPADRREEMREQKDRIEGRESTPSDIVSEAELDQRPVEFWMVFDQWTLAPTEPGEECFWMVAADADVLCEARRLTERWPGDRPWRPLAEACAIPVPHRWYGIGLLELGESLHDLIKGTFDISFDSGQLSNLPFGFYSSSIPLQAELIQLSPGQLYPVPGDPRAGIYFPTLPTRDQSWAFNVLGFALTLYQNLMAIGAIQQGQVPAGRASALRTFGTTFALIQQGDVRADQLLLRLFGGLRQVARNFHRMNRVLLPPGKELRLVGWDGAREQGYTRIEALDDIDAEAEFEFRPDFQNSNPQVLSQMLQSALAIVIQPLLIQAGITTLPQIYELVRDYLRALRLDARKYVSPPSGVQGRPILAEEAISMVAAGEDPSGTPLEGAGRHLEKLTEFVNSDEFGRLPPDRVEAFRRWLLAVAQLAQQERTAQAAAQFQQAMAQGGMGQGGVPTTVREPGMAEGTSAAEPVPVGQGGA